MNSCMAAWHLADSLSHVTLRCGPFDFKVTGLDDNKPRNILEEIVWCVRGRLVLVCGPVRPHLGLNDLRYKAKEIERMRNKQSLALLKAMVNSAAPARDFKAAILQKAKETGEPATQPTSLEGKRAWLACD